MIDMETCDCISSMVPSAKARDKYNVGGLVRKNELGTSPANTKMIPGSSPFEGIAMIAKMRAWVANIQL